MKRVGLPKVKSFKPKAVGFRSKIANRVQKPIRFNIAAWKKRGLKTTAEVKEAERIFNANPSSDEALRQYLRSKGIFLEDVN